MRGDVHELRAPRNVKGHEQAGRRFGVVVQSDLLPLSTLLIAPTSTAARPASFRPEIEVMGRMTLVLAEQVTAIDPSRLGERVGFVSRAELDAIESAIKVVMDLR